MRASVRTFERSAFRSVLLLEKVQAAIENARAEPDSTPLDSVARALFNLGYVNQPAGGITVINGMGFLVKWGFRKITSIYDLKAGDIVIFSDGTNSPNAKWHWFVLTAYDGPNTVSKYDCGAQ